MEEKTYRQRFISQWKKPGFYFIAISMALLIFLNHGRETQIPLALDVFIGVAIVAFLLPFLEMRFARMKRAWRNIAPQGRPSFAKRYILFLSRSYFKLPEFWALLLFTVAVFVLNGGFISTAVNAAIILGLPALVVWGCEQDKRETNQDSSE